MILVSCKTGIYQGVQPALPRSCFAAGAVILSIDRFLMAHLVLATDFSDNSLHAAQYAAGLFGVKDHVYTLLHAYMDAASFDNSWPGMADDLYQAAMQGMGEWADRLRAMPAFAGVVLNTEVLNGVLPMALNDLGREKHADLVVMGTRGRSGAALWGSNAAAVVKRSTLPVLVVPAQAVSRPVKRILFADDQKGVEVAGTRMMLRIALTTGAEVVLAHVVKDKDEEPDAEVVEMFEELLQAVPHRFVAVEGEDVAGAIELLADKEQADMVAVLHRHTGFLEGLFHASTAKRLALNTDLPLLVMPELNAMEARG
jgi:nucleotide-binding universal stress UspA family protein